MPPSPLTNDARNRSSAPLVLLMDGRGCLGAPGGARAGFLGMAANAGGESVALGGFESDDGMEHAYFSGGLHRFGLPS